MPERKNSFVGKRERKIEIERGIREKTNFKFPPNHNEGNHFSSTIPPYMSTVPAKMAVAVDQPGSSFEPTTPTNRRRRLLSFPHPDLDVIQLLGSSSVGSPHSLSTTSSTFHRSRSTPCLSSAANSDVGDSHTARIEILMGRKSPAVHSLIVEAAIALAIGIAPSPAPVALGSAYYLCNRIGQSLAVLKPAVNRSLGFAIGLPGGDGAAREVAAYLLDHGGFSGVPPTALVRISHDALLPQRVASIQRFVPHSSDAGDFGPSRFSVGSVHRIGILDVRLLNVDRHSGNILVLNPTDGEKCVGQAAAELVPIDHGLCLPELLEDPYFEWLHWPQAMVPFSEVEVEYIASLDPWKDAELLREELPVLREPSLRLLVLCTTFLKRAAAAGLCLADIGEMMTRGFSGGSGSAASVLEAICRQVELSMKDGNGDRKVADAVEVEGLEFDMETVKVKEEVVVDIPIMLHRPQENGLYGKLGDGDEEEDEEEERFGGEGAGKSFLKSASFGGSSERSRQGVVGTGMSFKSMGEEEWREFMFRFEEVVMERLEARKGMGLVRMDRLGSSCRF